MSQQPTTCDSRQISLFLAQQLDGEEQSAFELHLETCSNCRRTLETEAARAEIWSEARELLSSGGEHPTASDGPGTSDYVESDIGSVLGLLAPTDDPAMLGRLGTYEIVGVVGRGGMGVVLKGFDPRLNRFVAIKLLAPHLAASGSARRRFAREARAAAAVVHENIVAIHGVAEWQGLPYLVMPYVRGESLQKRLDRCGPLDVQEILRIGHQAAAGLAAAHAQGLVHRDIKPANILLEEGVERLQITDFGLARTVDDASETRTGIIAGTPQYMSPEQARGDNMDARSDLFSLGSVFYQMCTGRLPFRAETPYGILRRITDTEPRPIREISPEVPEWLTAIVATLHAKEPAERHSAAELVDWLRDCLAHLQRPTAIPLPGPVRQLAEQLAAKARQADPDSSGRWQRWLATRYRKVAVGIAAGLAFAVTTTLAIQQLLRPKKTEEQSASAAISMAAPPAWDAAADDIRQMTNDLADHESRAARLWDREPLHSPGFTQGQADTEAADAPETVSPSAEPSDSPDDSNATAPQPSTTTEN